MNSQETNVNKGFSKIYEHYDDIDQNGIIAKWMRKRVHKHVAQFMRAKSNVLELNAGSGLDAIHFAKNNHQVYATDISDGFVKFLGEKVRKENLDSKIELNQISFTEIGEINQKFDYVFSNFGGLNCIGDLNTVFKHFDKLTNENAFLSLVILPKYTPWEWLWYKKNKKVALRRFQSGSQKANVEGHQIDVWYHQPNLVKEFLKDKFKVIKIENLGFFTPTGANDDFPLKFPKIFNFLIWLDDKFQFLMPKGVGDYYIITLQKR